MNRPADEFVVAARAAVDPDHERRRRGGLPTFVLGLAALGVVFGDIGTSPLYAVDELLYERTSLHTEPTRVIGAISLVVWLLIVIISVKYVLVVLRADNDGEGGVFALSALVRRHRSRLVAVVTPVLVVAAGLLFGDGIITPAISVLSAVEGLRLAAPALDRWVVPLTLVVLVALFSVQHRGSHRVGSAYGPVMLVWFGALAVLGIGEIVRTPEILRALDPRHAVATVGAVGIGGIAPVLGAAVLVITGGEALYADLGHFGTRPIRLAWSVIVFPALLCNYLGQGAFVLGGGVRNGDTVFFSMIPTSLRLPMVALATAAAVIASQALITGAFSLAAQGSALGYLPRLRIVHTHEHHAGQIYVPAVNWSLLVGCALLVMIFGSSDALASTYGIAISGVMAATTLALYVVARQHWRRSRWSALALVAPFALVEAALIGANTTRLPTGGWVPVVVGIALATVMFTWRWGRREVRRSLRSHSTMPMRQLLRVHREPTERLPSSVLFLTEHHVRDLDDAAPPILELFWRRYHRLPAHCILLTIRQQRRPFVEPAARYEVEVLENDAAHGVSVLSIQAEFGFMEAPDLAAVIDDIAADPRLVPSGDLSQWTIHATKERVVASDTTGLLARLRFGLFKLLARNAEPTYLSFGLTDDTRLTVEYFAVKL